MSSRMQHKNRNVEKKGNYFTKSYLGKWQTANGNITGLLVKMEAIKNDEWFEFMSHIDLHTIATGNEGLSRKKSTG